MSKAARRESRERLRKERLAQQQRAKRNKLLAVLGAAVVVVALVVGGGYLYMTSAGRSANEFAGKLAPTVLQQDGSVVMAKKGAKAPVVEVYADFQCPACKQFESTNTDTLKKLAAQGKAIVHYRPVSIFAQQAAPLNSNSLRAGAAARAAADHGRFVAYNDILFENQPAEGSEGFAAADLKAWGKEVGITDPSFAKRVDAEGKVVDSYVDYIQKLVQKGTAEFGQDKMSTMPVGELTAWGRDNGISDAFLADSYVKEILDATDAVNERYSQKDKANAFGGTPAVYINGGLQGDDIYSVNALTEAVEAARPGKVDTEPAAGGGAPDGEPSPSESPVEK